MIQIRQATQHLDNVDVDTFTGLTVTSQLSINDITVVEGQNSNAILTVTVNNPSTQQITVNYTTTAIDATANVDYTSQTGARKRYLSEKS